MVDPSMAHAATGEMATWIGGGLGVSGVGSAVGIYMAIKSVGDKVDRLIEVMADTNTKLTLLLDRGERGRGH